MVLGSPALIAALFIVRAEAAGTLSQQLVAEVAAIRDTYRGAALPKANLQQPTTAYRMQRFTAWSGSGIIPGGFVSAPVNDAAAVDDDHRGVKDAQPCASNGLDAAPRANGAADNGGSRNNGVDHHGAHADMARSQPTGTGSPAPFDARSHYLYNASTWNADALRAREEDGTESPTRTERGRKAPSLGTCRCHAGGPARPYLRLDDMDALSFAASTINHQGSSSGDGATENTSPSAFKGAQALCGQPKLLEPRASSKGGDGWLEPPVEPEASSWGGVGFLWPVILLFVTVIGIELLEKLLGAVCRAGCHMLEQRRREHQQRDHQEREHQRRERQSREHRLREQQQREQQQREQQRREQQQREQQRREQLWREQQRRELQWREQHLREQQLREQQQAEPRRTALAVLPQCSGVPSRPTAHELQMQRLMSATSSSQVDWDYVYSHLSLLTEEQRSWAYQVVQWDDDDDEPPAATCTRAARRRRRTRGSRGGRRAHRRREAQAETPESYFDPVLAESEQLLQPDSYFDPVMAELEQFLQLESRTSERAQPLEQWCHFEPVVLSPPPSVDELWPPLQPHQDLLAPEAHEAASHEAEAREAEREAEEPEECDTEAQDAAEVDMPELELFSPGGTATASYEPMDEQATSPPGGTLSDSYVPFDSSSGDEPLGGIGSRVHARHEARRDAADSIAARVSERRRAACSVATEEGLHSDEGAPCDVCDALLDELLGDESVSRDAQDALCDDSPADGESGHESRPLDGLEAVLKELLSPRRRCETLDCAACRYACEETECDERAHIELGRRARPPRIHCHECDRVSFSVDGACARCGHLPSESASQPGGSLQIGGEGGGEVP
jgi:hypothetical protein